MTTTEPDFDRLAVVIDWLDACRARDLPTLLNLYEFGARLHCGCSDGAVHTGRVALESYWHTRLARATPAAFQLDEINPAGDSVVLDYRSFEDKPVRMVFDFSSSGKILQTRCEPA